MKSTSSVGELLPATRLLGTKTKDFKSSLNPRNPRRNQENTEATAEKLVDYLNAPDYYNGFLKVAWRLDDNTIFRLAGLAKEKATNPPTYFMVCAKNEMKKT